MELRVHVCFRNDVHNRKNYCTSRHTGRALGSTPRKPPSTPQVPDTHIFALTNKIMPQQKRVAQTATVAGMAAVSHKSRLVNAGLLDGRNKLDPQFRFRFWLLCNVLPVGPTPPRLAPPHPAPLRLASPHPAPNRLLFHFPLVVATAVIGSIQ